MNLWNLWIQYIEYLCDLFYEKKFWKLTLHIWEYPKVCVNLQTDVR